MPIEYVRVDDSYQVSVGDWPTLNDKYPRGMPFLSDAIHSHGYKAGIWLAPFLLSERSEVYADHPD
jgi:alpha-galactosidase